MKRLFLLLQLVIAVSASAAVNFDDVWTERGFVTVDAERASGPRELYVEYKRAARGEPTFILLNGLTYTTREWNAYTEALLTKNPDVGVLRIDLEGQGQTQTHGLQRLYEDIPIEQQARDVITLIQELNIRGRKISVGLSYGGGLAFMIDLINPRVMDQTIAIAPFLEPLKSQDEWIRNQIAWTRIYQPWNPSSDDELYDFYLKQLIYSTYAYVEPIVLENPYRLEGVFRMVKGIRKFIVRDHVNELPRVQKFHFVQPLQDQYVGQEVYNSFWDVVPTNRRASRLLLQSTQHKVPEAEPVALATWTLEIANGNPELFRGETIELSPDDLTLAHGLMCGGSFK